MAQRKRVSDICMWICVDSMSIINQRPAVCVWWCHISRPLRWGPLLQRSDAGRLRAFSLNSITSRSTVNLTDRRNTKDVRRHKSQVILSPASPSNKSHLQLSVFPSVYPSPSRPAQDWWRDGGKNQCFPASCVMFRDGWCVDGSFSWSIRPDSLHLFPFLSLTWFPFVWASAGGRWNRIS